ncbi:MAG: hypothetical protein KDE27_31705 [Planctomycetes bacterium]|nr:hypothetical protein [Planctomycetota bacterium]
MRTEPNPTASALALLASLQLGTLRLAAQSPVAWQTIGSMTPPAVAAWDPASASTLLFVDPIGPLAQWEWDGASFRQRQNVTGLATSQRAPRWLGTDPIAGRVLALDVPSHGAARVGRWDGARWTWQPGPILGYVRNVCFDAHRGRIVVLESTTGSGAPSVREFDGTTWWTIPFGPGPLPRTGAAFAFDPISARCILYGGDPLPLECWAWDGASWTLLANVAAPGSRRGAAMAFSSALGRLVLYGGSAATTTWSFDGAGWIQIATAHDPGLRENAVLVAEPVDLLLTGGARPATSWRFTGTDWAALGDLATPAMRLGGAAAYDAVRQQVVLFGGLTNSADAGQLFDGRWHDIVAGVAPAARAYLHLHWSGIDQAVLLFGGDGAIPTSGVLGDTWLWNGSVWLQRLPAQSPPPRANGALTADVGGGLLLFGGSDANTNALGDHWHWDGTTWTPVVTPAMPLPSARCRAAFDPARSRVVLLGYDGAAARIATWEWDGVGWTKRQPQGGPAVSGPADLAFDPRRGRVVAAAQPIDAWNGTNWTPLPWLPTNESTFEWAVVTDLGAQRALGFLLPGATVAHLTEHPNAVETVGHGCAIGPAPLLQGLQRPALGAADFALDLGPVPPLAPAFLAFGFGGASMPLGGGCSSFAGPAVATVWRLAGTGGLARFPVPIPNLSALRDLRFVAQGAALDPAGGAFGGLVLTPGIAITIGE